jgi:hypothetical protein
MALPCAAYPRRSEFVTSRQPPRYRYPGVESAHTRARVSLDPEAPRHARRGLSRSRSSLEGGAGSAR